MINALLVAMLALQIVDYLTTAKVLSQGGRENNPVVRWLIDRMGMLGLAVAKSTGGAVAGALWYFEAPYAEIAIGAACLVYARVVYHNYREIK